VAGRISIEPVPLIYVEKRVAVAGRKCCGDYAGTHRLQLCRCTGEGPTELQSADHGEKKVVGAREEWEVIVIGGGRTDRQSKIKCATYLESEEPGWCNSKNPRRFAFDENRRADCGVLAAKLALPKRVADYGAGDSAAGFVFFGLKKATLFRGNSERIEGFASEPQSDGFSLINALANADVVGAPGKYAGKGLLMVANLFP
jgi:hypothetical protein